MDIRVGCKRDARKAVRGELMFVKSGLHRSVFCDARHKIVYKVHNPNVRDWSPNRVEDERANDLRARGVPYIPPTTLWVVEDQLSKRFEVVAMPMYVTVAQDIPEWNDDIDMMYADIEEVACDNGIGDMHDGNWMLDAEGMPWIVDLAL